MPSTVLLVEVGLLDRRWHGVGDWPPSPFRLFQALVAGAYGGRWAAEGAEAQARKDAAFRWLEQLAPPRIAVPPRTLARTVTYFVPDNDLDAKGGDPRRVAEIRSAKEFAPTLLEGATSFLYAWTFDADEACAKQLCRLADRLHTFGKGVDAAFARAEVTSPEAAEARLIAHGGAISRPASGNGWATAVPCPAKGSLDSLTVRHAATVSRLRRENQGKEALILFRQPPKAHARPVAYDCPPTCLVYDVRSASDLRRFRPIPQERVLDLTQALRDGAAARLSGAAPETAAIVERFLVGRGATGADVGRRVRIVPLPSIGHRHASPSVRRVAVEVPPDCPIRPRDVAWAFAGLGARGFDVIDPDTGELLGETVLSAAEASQMPEHYGFDVPAIRWRSVTPVVLPRVPGRTRSGAERAETEARSADAIRAALRHAGVAARAVAVRIQREPFHGKGARAEAFAPGRFIGRLRHVEILFDQPIPGPLLVGDGRFAGLGLMRPVDEVPSGLHLFAVDPKAAPSIERAEPVARALRRAVMALAQRELGRGPLPKMFHGHEADGAPARSGRHEHLFFAAYASNGGSRIDRVAVVAPGLADRSVQSRDGWALLAHAVADIDTLRAGSDGVLALSPVAADDAGPFGSGRVWISATPYRPARHPARRELERGLVDDLAAECARRGLPRPDVKMLKLETGPRGGISAWACLTFAVELTGPLMLGRKSHLGLGLFRPER